MVPRPGFEPGTTASSGQRSPTELPGQADKFDVYVRVIACFHFPKKAPENFLVGPLRFELRTSAMSRRRHNRLDHEPISLLLTFFAPKCNSIVRIIIYISFGWFGLLLYQSASKDKGLYTLIKCFFAVTSYFEIPAQIYPLLNP